MGNFLLCPVEMACGDEVHDFGRDDIRTVEETERVSQTGCGVGRSRPPETLASSDEDTAILSIERSQHMKLFMVMSSYGDRDSAKGEGIPQSGYTCNSGLKRSNRCNRAMRRLDMTPGPHSHILTTLR